MGTKTGFESDDNYNGAESFHGHLNAEFLAPHPNIYVFVRALLRQQTATYIATGSLSFTRRQPADIHKHK